MNLQDYMKWKRGKKKNESRKSTKTSRRAKNSRQEL